MLQYNQCMNLQQPFVIESDCFTFALEYKQHSTEVMVYFTSEVNVFMTYQSNGFFHNESPAISLWCNVIRAYIRDFLA